MPTSTVRFPTSDGLMLEGRFAVPETPRAVAVLCHPHPSYSGSMSSAMIPAIQRALERSDVAALRFNFRGVGRSEGRYGGGVDELKDVAAALGYVSQHVPGLPLTGAGWSFGAIVGLHGVMADGRPSRYVAIAPPVSVKARMELPVLPIPERAQAWRGSLLAVCGTTDGFCTPAGLRRWAEQIPGSSVRIFEGEDHFFTSGRDELADVVASFLSEAQE